jgi:hypothetical protein
MGSESLPDPPESSQFTGTKRFGALPFAGRETKRLCTQPGRLPPGSAALELSNGHDWCGGFGIASNPGFDSAVSQCGIGPGTKWGNTVPPGVFGLDSTPIHPAAGSDPLLFNQIPVEMREMNMQSNPGAERLFPHRNVCSFQPYVSREQRCLCSGSAQARLTFGSGLLRSTCPYSATLRS